MPRPKKNRASASFFVRGHRFSDAAATRIVELLGLPNLEPFADSLRRQILGAQLIDKQPGAPIRFIRVPETSADGQTTVERSIPTDTGKILRKIEIALGTYLDGAKHLDNTPRPIHYVATFKALGRDAGNLLNDLAQLSDYFADQFAYRDEDIHAIENALASVIDVSVAVMRDFRGRSSKGARKNTALCLSIKQLRQIFRSYYVGPRTGPQKRGAFKVPGEEESRELDFVEAALRDARIIPKGHRAKLQRLLRDARCAMPEQRSGVIERIATRAESARREGVLESLPAVAMTPGGKKGTPRRTFFALVAVHPMSIMSSHAQQRPKGCRHGHGNTRTS